MKKWIAILAIALSMVSMSAAYADDARRFGGGMSFGRSAPTLQKSTPAPAAGVNQQQRVNPAQQQRQQQAAPNQARPQQAAPSPMRGMLMGLAAALGITALAHALGFGEGFAQFLMIALMALAAFYIIRLVLGLFLVKRRPAGMPGGAQSSASQENNMRSSYDYSMPQQSQPSQTAFGAASPMAGSVLDELNNPNSAQKVELPAGFDVDTFLKVAEANFVKMQKAWDTGNVTSISDFTTDEVFRTVTHQLRERGSQDYETEIVTLKSDFRGIVRDGDEYLAGVHFDGTINVSGEAERVDETWILSKPVEGNSGWLLAGIHQESAQ